MVNTNDIKMDIINLVSKINDLKKLKLIYKNLEQVDRMASDTNGSDEPLNFRDGVVEIREGVSYEQILREQNYQPIDYKEFRALAEQIEWQHSLEELLEALD